MDQNIFENLPPPYLHVASGGLNDEYILSDPLDPLATEAKWNCTEIEFQENGWKMENSCVDDKNQLQDLISHMESDKVDEYVDTGSFIKMEEPASDDDVIEKGLVKVSNYFEDTNNEDRNPFETDVKPILKNMEIDGHIISEHNDREVNAYPMPCEQPLTTRTLRSNSSAQVLKINDQHQTNAEHKYNKEIFFSKKLYKKSQSKSKTTSENCWTTHKPTSIQIKSLRSFPSSVPSRGNRTLAHTQKDISSSSYSKPPNNYKINGKLMNTPFQTKSLAKRTAGYSQAASCQTTNNKSGTNSLPRKIKPTRTTTSMLAPSKKTTNIDSDVTKENNMTCQNNSSETKCNQFKNLQQRRVSKKIPIKRFVCKHCGKALASNTSLKHHLTMHSDTKSYVCHICCKAFKSHRTLYAHNQFLHANKNIKCDVCSKVYRSKISFRVHIRKVHEKVINEKSMIPASCDECGKMYANKRQLQDHCRNMHRKGLEFICNDCSATFKRKDILKTHIIVNHLPPTVPCDKCSNHFVTIGHLNRHLRYEHLIDTRRSYICEVCGKVTKSIEKRKNHLLTHTNLMLFTCEVCGKCFRTESNLKQHSHIHSDIRPYSCDLCEMSFKIRHHLRQHMAVHGMVSTPGYEKRGKQR